MRIPLVMVMLLFSTFLSAQFGPYHMLHHWELFKSGENQPLGKVEIPGNLHLDLQKLGVIEDPMVGLNEADLQWVGETDWEYVHQFEVELRADGTAAVDHSSHMGHEHHEHQMNQEEHQEHKDHMDHDLHAGHMMHTAFVVDGGHQELVFKGLDTYADVYLNDELIISANNMFREWVTPVEGKLKNGTNTIRVHFKSPEKIESSKLQESGLELPGGSRVYSRKAQYHYGWDWGPKYVTAGIWQNAFIQTWEAARITDVWYETVALTDELAEIKAHITIESDGHHLLSLQPDADFPGNSTVIHTQKGKQVLEVDFEIQNPELWWSKGMGDQHLYRFQLSLLKGDKKISHDIQNIGLRTVQLIMEPDQFGESFYFLLNGQKVYARGANYIPQSSFVFGYIPDYLQFFKDVGRSNINMLRVWGGGIYEFDVFYDFCNRNGILVWQDFMFACAMYPSDEKFVSNVKEEADYQIRRLRNHASIALWCGNNEVAEGWARWGWQDNYSRKEIKRISKGYNKIFIDVLPELVSNLDPDVGYTDSSPRFGRGDKRYTSEGDAHDWWVWHDGYPFSHFEENVPRFMSEFGFQAYPDFETIREYYYSMMPEDFPTARALADSGIEAHQKHPRGDEVIRNYMTRSFDPPEKFADYVRASQWVQADGIRRGIEAQRRSRPRCMGSLYWQMNDVWPATSWSGIDAEGRWKALQYQVKNAYKEVLVSMQEDSTENLQVWIVNDRVESAGVVLNVRIFNLQTGEVIGAEAKFVDVPAGSSSICYSLKSPVARGNYFVRAEIKEFGNVLGSASYYFEEPKNTSLTNPGFQVAILSMEPDMVVIQLEVDYPARSVCQYTPLDGWFDDNWFDMVPGQTKTVRFYPDEPQDDMEGFMLNIWSLYNIVSRE